MSTFEVVEGNIMIRAHTALVAGTDVVTAGPARLRAWLAEGARRFGDKPFATSIDQGKTISFAQFHELTERLGRYLAAAGFEANDRVALLSNNSIEHLATYIGVMAYGATICTVHVEMNATRVDEILHRLGPRLVLYEEALGLERLARGAPWPALALGDWSAPGGTGLCALLGELPCRNDQPAAGIHGVSAEDVACILFTSGTAASPKGVVLTFRELLDNVVPTADAFAITDADRILDYRSYNWASAQILSGLAPLAKGATVLMARKFSQHRFFDWVREHRATIAAGNPTTINMLLNRTSGVPAADVRTLRFMTSSSAPLLVDEWQRFEQRFGITIAQGFGTSETGWIAGSRENARRMGSVGRPFAYQQLAIVDAAGRGLPAGETGSVEIGGEPSHRYRYLDDDGVIRVNGTGRIRTGDLGYLDPDGFLFLTGREKDLIIRGGVNISPLEIDDVLVRHVAILEAATIGVPDPIRGEEVVSYVVLRPHARVCERAVIEHCAASLAMAKVPKRVLFRSSLPKTERGKMDRKTLVAEWKAEEGSGGASEGR